MALPTLADAHAHLRISGDDERVQSCLDAAIAVAADYIGVTIPWEDEDGVLVDVPAPVSAAILLLTATLYDRRHTGTPILQYPMAEATLLHPYRVMGI